MGRCERLTVTPRSTPLNLLIVVCDARIITRRWVFLTLMHVAWQANGSGVERYGQRVFGRCSFQKAGKKTSMTGRGRQKLGTPRPPDAQLKTVRGGPDPRSCQVQPRNHHSGNGPRTRSSLCHFADLSFNAFFFHFFSFLLLAHASRPLPRALVYVANGERKKENVKRNKHEGRCISKEKQKRPWKRKQPTAMALGRSAGQPAGGVCRERPG